MMCPWSSASMLYFTIKKVHCFEVYVFNTLPGEWHDSKAGKGINRSLVKLN